MKCKTSKALFFCIIALLFVALSMASALQNSPTSCSGAWTSCTKAFADDTSQATASASASSNKTGVWNNYGFSFPSSSAITSVQVKADFFASNIHGYVNIRVSGNGGATYGPVHTIGGNTLETHFTIDVTNDTSWTSAKLNNSNLRVQATCFKQGGGSNPTCKLDWIPVQVTYTPFDFTVSDNPMAGTVAQRKSITTLVTVTSLGGIPQPVTLTQIGCPAATTCTFNPTSGNPTFNSTLNISTTNSTPIGNYLIQIIGTGDSKVRNTTYNLTVENPFDFSIAANPASDTGVQGDNKTTNVTLSLISGSSQLVTLSQAGCPPASTCSFAPASSYPSFTSLFSVATTLATPAGNYLLTLTGTGDGKSHNTTYNLTINSACQHANPTVVISPTTQSATAGTTLSYTATVTNNDNGPCGNSTFNLSSGIPTGWAGSFSSNTLTLAPTNSGSVTFSITSDSNAIPENYTFNNTATNANAITYTGTGSAIYEVVLGFDFDLSATPNLDSVTQGNNATTTINVTLLQGSSQSVTLTQSGCPPNAICTFNDPTDFPSFVSNFIVSTTLSTPAGIYPISIRGTGGNKTHNTTYTLTVNQSCVRANPTVSVTPSIQTGNAGSTLNYNTTVTNHDNSACGSSTFNMTQGIPSGWFGSFSSNTLTLAPGSSGVVVFSITSASNSAPGNYTFNNTATNANVPTYTGTGSAVYQVTAAFDFNISANPANDSVVQGGTKTTTVTLGLISGSSQIVNLTRSGCPFFSTCTFSPTSGLPTFSSTFTVTTTASTPVGTYFITLTGTGGNKVHSTLYTLTVNSTPCNRSNPRVNITPIFNNGSAGSTLNYTFFVVNKDSMACGNSTFNLTYTLPNFNWQGTFDKNTLLLAPGYTGSAVFSLTSDVNSSSGNYNFTNTASNSAAPTYQNTATATYHVN